MASSASNSDAVTAGVDIGMSDMYSAVCEAFDERLRLEDFPDCPGRGRDEDGGYWLVGIFPPNLGGGVETLGWSG